MKFAFVTLNFMSIEWPYKDHITGRNISTTSWSLYLFLLQLTLKVSYVGITQDRRWTRWQTARRLFTGKSSQRNQTLRVLHPSWETRRKLSLSRWRTSKCSTRTHLHLCNKNHVLLTLAWCTFLCGLHLQMTRVSCHLRFCVLLLRLHFDISSGICGKVLVTV